MVMADSICERVSAAVALHTTYEQPFDRFVGIATEEQIAEFESLIGFVMPPAFRCLQLNEPNVALYGQISWSERGAWPVEFAELYYLDGTIQGEYKDLHYQFFYPPDDPEALSEWLTKLVPLALFGGNSALCLDFAFDAKDPPVIVIDGEFAGSPSRRNVRYIAGSFMEYLDLELGEGEDREMPLSVHNQPGRTTRRLVDWYAHRDQIMGPPPDPPPTAYGINT